MNFVIDVSFNAEFQKSSVADKHHVFFYKSFAGSVPRQFLFYQYSYEPFV